MALLLCSTYSFAEGYQVNTLSTRQLGMGHVGAGMKLGAESMLFNPAALAFMNQTLDISAGITAIYPKVTATIGDSKYPSRNHFSTPLYLYTAFKIYDNFKAGITFYTPYGSNIDWTDNWPGAILTQKVKLSMYSVQPTLSWKITPKLSIGAGMSISWGNVDLNKGLVNASSMDILLSAMGNSYRYGNTTPVSVNLKGTSNLAAGFNVGIMYDVSRNVTLGASFRSKSLLKVKAGDASVSYANQLSQQLLEKSVGLINEANFSAELPMPYVFTIGTSYRPLSRLILAFDAQLNGWKAYQNLIINFDSEQLKQMNQNLPKHYHNAWAFRLGAQYALTHRFDLRAGISYDNTPVNKKYYNPETPGMDKISPTIGFSFRPINQISIDVALSYVAGVGAKNTSYTYDDIIFKNIPALGHDAEQTLKADYKAQATCMALGLRYSF